MDVRKIIFTLIFSLLSVACSQPQEHGKVTESLYSERCQDSAIKNSFAVHWKSGKVTFEKAANREEFIANFVEVFIDEIDFVEYDQKLELHPSSGSENLQPMSSINWGAQDARADVVWSQGITGEDIVVAVIDTGMDTSHPQLSQQVYYNKNEIPNNNRDDDGNGYVDDYAGYNFYANNGNVNDGTMTGPGRGHGTHVSGIVAAEHSDDFISRSYVQGLAPKAKILPLKFLGDDGGSTEAALHAIDYAVARGAKVINASWGGPGCSEALRKKIAGLSSKNVLFIAAAGNSGKNLDDDLFPEYPAAFTLDAQIAVGATTFFTGMAEFSNYGFQSVELFAPGMDIRSTYPNSSTATMSGTSMAAPFVAGAAALVWSYKPSATAAQVKQALLNSVLVTPGYFNVTRGRLDVAQAIEEIDLIVQ